MRKPEVGAQSVSNSFVIGDVVLVHDVSGDVTITTQRPSYRVEEFPSAALPLSVAAARAQPARLLQPRYAAVPFTGRETVLADLSSWLGDDTAVSARLIHATGGQGKTRLAAHLATECVTAGWSAWRLHHSPTQSVASHAAMPRQGGVLAVVDYADRWPLSHLLTMLTNLNGLSIRTGTAVRALLLARSMGVWWPALVDRLDSELANDATEIGLTPLGEQIDSTVLYETARHHFAQRLEVNGTESLTYSPHRDDPLVLGIHMAALAGVDAYRIGSAAPISAHQVSAYFLRREYAHWRLLHGRAEDPISTSDTTMRRAAYLATLTGTQLRQSARAALMNTELVSSVRSADQIIDDHHMCYPPTAPTTVFEPLHPDRLGEDFLALIDPRNPHRDDAAWLCDDWTLTALPNLLAKTTEDNQHKWTPAAMATLVETARRWPHIATELLYPLVRKCPELAIAAGGATLARMVTLDSMDTPTLVAIDALLPPNRHVDLDVASAAVSAALTPLRLADTPDPNERAHLLTNHALRLSNAGRHDEALATADEATDLYRQLAESDSATHLPNLATSLTNLGNALYRLGRHDDALIAAQEAVTIRRQLTESDPATHLPHLANSLNSLSTFLTKLGRRDRALTTAQEATGLYRQLAQANPAAHLPYLAVSLNNLGNHLAQLGHRDDALTTAQEAVTTCRQLAQVNPAAHLPRLAAALISLSASLAELGHRDDALTTAQEAVTTCRQLAQVNPAAHLPDLAMSLNNLSNTLDELGHRDKALAIAQEATGLHRQLAQANPGAHLPDLAMSLSNFGIRLQRLSRTDEALTAVQEAVTIRRQLAQANPAAHLPDFATTLNNLSALLLSDGRSDDALTTIHEAVTIRRQLTQANPAAHLPDLAMSLWALAAVRVKLDAELAEALDAVGEAITIFDSLTQQVPQRFARYLVSALATLADVLDGLGRAEEASEVRRQIAELP